MSACVALATVAGLTKAHAGCGGAHGGCGPEGDLPSSFGGAPAWAAVKASEIKSSVGRAAADVTRAGEADAVLRPAPKNAESASLKSSSAAGKSGAAASQCRAGKPTTGAANFTFDGEPVDTSSVVQPADSQYCVDRAMQQADIQVRYDGFSSDPSLNVVASPNAANAAVSVRFDTYTNYATSLARGEIRIFESGESVKGSPVAVIPLDEASAQWTPPRDARAQYEYVLRVYDRESRFDETTPKTLDLATSAGGSVPNVDRAALVDNNTRYVKNIPINGGTILVSGRNLTPGQRVTVMGQPAEVDPTGAFAFKQILPSGDHDVDVAVIDQKGVAAVYTRSATIPEHDLFYVGLAEVTAGRQHSRGPIGLIAPDQADDFKGRQFVDGRLALYLKGKIKGDTLITLAADTRDQPINRLFTNFSSKDPTYLLRTLDPNRYYPVYGDDSTLVEDAPTRGKFYVRVEKGDSSVTWGNFKTAITGTEFARYDRGLYGLRVASKTAGSTKFGERRGTIEGFVAEPGTTGVRDVFLGTGGSSYFLSHQNVTQGSERITIEVRDRVTGLVLQTKTLSPTQDYSVNYVQGRIDLNSVLTGSGSSDFIVQSGGFGGVYQYIVVNYEYAAGLTPTKDRVVGGRASYWVNDHVQVGATAYNQRGVGEKLLIGGADVTLRLTPQTYIKAEIARTTGTGGAENISIDGGYSFATQKSAGGRAYARRVEGAADLADFLPGSRGRIAAFWKEKQANYAGPGEITTFNSGPTRDLGARGEMQFGEKWTGRLKLDGHKDSYRDYYAGEANLAYAFAERWRITGGVRADQNDVRQLTMSRDLNLRGKRVDVALRLDYLRGRDWGVYGFGQATALRTEQRKRNDRVGVGAYTRLSEKVTANAEISTGTSGVGGKAGVEYKNDDTRTTYLNYAFDPDRTDILDRGGLGMLTSGARRRFTDDASVFGEVRNRNGGGFSGLTHAYGLEYAPAQSWRFGARSEFGTLTDPIQGTVNRVAVSPNVGYVTDKFSVSSRFEYRRDKTTTAMGATALPYGAISYASPAQTRQTYLMANSLMVKMSPDWRLLGKLSGSYSNSTKGDYYNGNYLEGVVGFAYRPVENDRLNMLFKYTYFYNVPSPGQVAIVAGLNDYAQQSHVLSADAIYDVNRWFAVGGKIGLRSGLVKDNTINGPWRDSTALLTIARMDVHIVKQWDLTLEVRRLALLRQHNAQTGGLAALYRQINDNFKIGVGYNLTRFSDDLTNMSMRNKGVFVNAIGMF